MQIVIITFYILKDNKDKVNINISRLKIVFIKRFNYKGPLGEFAPRGPFAGWFYLVPNFIIQFVTNSIHSSSLLYVH